MTSDVDQLEASQGVMMEAFTALKIAIFNPKTVTGSSQECVDKN
jgi:hypothetical protein